MKCDGLSKFANALSTDLARKFDRRTEGPASKPMHCNKEHGNRSRRIHHMPVARTAKLPQILAIAGA
jgi:hypothetical protein